MMTTNEAVAYIEQLIEQYFDRLPIVGHFEPIHKRIKKDSKEAMTIIKQDLKGGFKHYTGET